MAEFEFTAQQVFPWKPIVKKIALARLYQDQAAPAGHVGVLSKLLTHGSLSPGFKTGKLSGGRGKVAFRFGWAPFGRLAGRQLNLFLLLRPKTGKLQQRFEFEGKPG